jgi:gas vesicle protein
LVESKLIGENIMKYVLSFALGAATGALVALLFAPSSGEELRANIKTQADTQYAKAQQEWQKATQELQTRMDKMSTDLQALTNRSKETDKPA